MTTYGTIPTSAEPAAPLDFISRAKERGRSVLATRKPWRELADIHAISFPPSIGEAYLRVRSNAAYFAMNYAIIVLAVVFVSLLWHPISLIVFLVMLIAWLFLYFLREEPILVFGYTIGNTAILIGLSVLTLALLLLTGATVNILVSLLLGLLVVLIHAVLRKTEDREGEEGVASVPGSWLPSVADWSSAPAASAPLRV